MDRGRSLVFAACALSGLLAVLGPAEAAGEEARILSPSGSAAVFGEVLFAVETGSSPVEEVELRLDGRTVAKLSDVPFELTVDVGQENAEHLFEAWVRPPSGPVLRLQVTTPAIHVDEVIEADLQQVFVTVTDSSGRRQPGLRREDFRLEDDGRTQDLVTIAFGAIPFTAVVLLDASISMVGPQEHAARAGLAAFADGLADHDEARLLVFGDRLLGASPYTQDAAELVALLEELLPPAGTAIFDHLYMALRLLEPRLGRRVVILLSDGWDVHSVLRMQAVRETARRSQAMIYWLEIPRPRKPSGQFLQSFLPPDEVQAERRRLVRSIEETGGRVLRATNPEEIRSALQEVLQELREQYALGYYPSPAADGRWRALRCRVRQRGLRVRAPAGYFAASPGPP
ncbi:MAG: VWA domain-containing protein [Acidobacteria bacterium]|nr:VWA domain-containing protein [Acidobacteriota bacterium]